MHYDIQKMKEKLKDHNFIIVNIPHIFSKDESLKFRIDFVVYVKSSGKDRKYYYRKMKNISCNENQFWFEYPGGGRLKFEVKEPAKVVEFMLNAKEGVYPTFKDIE